MTPKEKAKKIWDYHYYFVSSSKNKNDVREICRQCALITIEEMLDFRNGLYINEGSLAHQYLIEVKREIQMI